MFEVEFYEDSAGNSDLKSFISLLLESGNFLPPQSNDFLTEQST